MGWLVLLFTGAWVIAALVQRTDASPGWRLVASVLLAVAWGISIAVARRRARLHK